MLESNQAVMETPRKFNLHSRNDPVQSFFGVKPLDESEANVIEKLLVDNLHSDNDPEEHLNSDIENLKTLTSEIKAINKQGILLIGERIHKARELLKSYIDGTFIKWIELTFDSKSTGYNMLYYYELHQKLPNSAKEDLKKIPQKAAYMLASRKGDIEKKAELISENHNLKADEIMLLIQKQFPSSRNTLIKDPNTRLIQSIHVALNTLSTQKKQLSQQQKKTLLNLTILIENIVK